MAERQTAPSISGIRGDHVARYEFAATRLSGTVLDVGCGCGYGALIMAQAGIHVKAVDRSKRAIDYACTHYRHGHIKYFQLVLPQLPKGEFDAAVLFEIIEHVGVPKDLLRVLSRQAARLIVSTPNQEVLPFSSDRFPYHVRHYTPGELEDLLTQAGYQVTEWWCQTDAFQGKLTRGTAGRTISAIAERSEP